MRVLISPAQTNLSFAYGSESSWAYNIVTRLAKYFNIQMDVVCGKADRLTLPNVRIFEVGFERGDLITRALFYFKCCSVAKKLYKKADIVHHMFPFGFRTAFNMLAVSGNLKEKPFVIGPIQYPQEYIDVTEYEWVSGREGLKARFLYGIENITVKFILQPLLTTFHEITLNEAEALVFDSKKTLKLCENLYSDLLKDKVLKVIPPGIETEIFRYIPPAKKDYFEIMTSGYILKRKGIQYLIKAMPIILKEFKNVKLRIVGDGPFKGQIMRLVKKLKLSDKVSFEGIIPRNELLKYYANCDVFVQPSLSETFPSTIREAMSTGRPVVATKVGFLEEHIIDGINGFLVPKGNFEALAEKIILLLSDEDLRLKIGIKAREYAMRNFDWDKIIKTWYNIYHKIIYLKDDLNAR